MSTEKLLSFLNGLSPRMRGVAERILTRFSYVREKIDQEADQFLAENEEALRPRRGGTPGTEQGDHRGGARFSRLPESGVPREDLIREIRTLAGQESGAWSTGKASGAVYNRDDEHIEFLNRVYAAQSQSNPLHADLWPSASKFEAEIVAMTGSMLSADATEGGEAYGTVTSGGTESILLAVKTYRDRARAQRGIRRPQMVVPATAHAAFDKAAELFGVKIVHVPVDKKFRANIEAMRRSITRNTILLVGSAPSFPHGAIDPIPELSEIARARGIGFHTDSCLGGFVLPWAKRLGYDVPPFDFELPGVTSISADTHKYGYAAKGTSVVLYRSPALRRFQYFTFADWSGGLYFSPTLAGSRPGGLSAAAWAALLSMGESGYLEATRSILAAAAKIKAGIQAIEGLTVLGDPLWVNAFSSEKFDIYRVLDAMAERGWSLNGLQKPAAIHLCVTLRHTLPGVSDEFLADLRWAVEQARTAPAKTGGMAPVYGLAASMPLRGAVKALLARYIDLLYKT